MIRAAFLTVSRRSPRGPICSDRHFHTIILPLASLALHVSHALLVAPAFLVAPALLVALPLLPSLTSPRPIINLRGLGLPVRSWEGGVFACSEMFHPVVIVIVGRTWFLFIAGIVNAKT